MSHLHRAKRRRSLENHELIVTFDLGNEHVLNLHYNGLFVFEHSQAGWKPIWEINFERKRVLAYFYTLTLRPLGNRELHRDYLRSATVL